MLFAAESFGQNSSLLGQRDQRQGLTLERASWTYQKVAEQRPIGLNDQVTVWVDSKSVVINDGQMDRKKNGYGSLTLAELDFVQGFLGDSRSAIGGRSENPRRSR